MRFHVQRQNPVLPPLDAASVPSVSQPADTVNKSHRPVRDRQHIDNLYTSFCMCAFCSKARLCVCCDLVIELFVESPYRVLWEFGACWVCVSFSGVWRCFMIWINRQHTAELHLWDRFTWITITHFTNPLIVLSLNSKIIQKWLNHVVMNDAHHFSRAEAPPPVSSCSPSGSCSSLSLSHIFSSTAQLWALCWQMLSSL